jgi:hypothetical protein
MVNNMEDKSYIWFWEEGSSILNSLNFYYEAYLRSSNEKDKESNYKWAKSNYNDFVESAKNYGLSKEYIDNSWNGHSSVNKFSRTRKLRIIHAC